MLSAEAARAGLANGAASERDRAKGVRVHKLLAPALASEVVAAVEDNQRPWYRVAQQLDDLSLGKRERVLSAISPQLGKALARWWDWSVDQPYQRGWQRRAYRSSDRGDSLAARWVEMRQFLLHASQYPQPLVWQAEWAMHLGLYVPLGSLFASAIADGDTAVATVLMASIRGEHDISGPAQHAYVALLSAPDPAGWSEVERLLVAAERSEGLRQSILEASDLAHPLAFARILDLVVEHKLARFAATVRALGVWIGEDLKVRQEKEVAHAVASIRNHLQQPPNADALVNADPIEAFLGVWSLAVRDVRVAIRAAERLLESPQERSRLAAARLLTDFSIRATEAGLTRAVADPSLQVYAAAVTAWPAHLHGFEQAVVPMSVAVRGNLNTRVRELGKLQDVETGLIGTLVQKVGSTHAADVLICHSGDRALDSALVSAASANGRWVAARQYAKQPAMNRAALFSLIADRSTMVRDTVGGALRSLPSISSGEARILEDALTRKAADLRATALALLQKQQEPALAESLQRLTSGTADQKRAADDLGGRGEAATPAKDEVPASVRFKVEDRTPAVRPVGPPKSSWDRHHDGFRLAWTSLRAWLAEHADLEVQTFQGVELLANVRWIHAGKDGSLPLPEVLGPWWERIAPQLTDGGVEVALLAHIPRANRQWITDLTRTVVGPVASELPKVGVNALQWQALRVLGIHAKRASWTEPLLDLLETAASALPIEGLRAPAEVLQRRGRRQEKDRWGNPLGFDERGPFRDLFSGTTDFIDPAELNDEQLGRLWRAARFIDEPEGAIDRWDGPKVEVDTISIYGVSAGTRQVPDQPNRWAPTARLLVEAFNRGAATSADLVDALVVAPRVSQGYSFAPRQDALRALTGLRP